MAECNDYWCEHYGSNSIACAKCTEKNSEKNKPDLLVLLNSRKIELMESNKETNIQGQSR